ncbi:uncharacterized protein LOC111889972 [Lactuca sativa]|uniref:uncharacterized protein LOC111889972 n=1 Tax=Lactuca sativa TaxID=4236 RepID=UPI000CD99B12|nr:uncharacterized protein LOC111889972 [Lactuca sativa]
MNACGRHISDHLSPIPNSQSLIHHHRVCKGLEFLSSYPSFIDQGEFYQLNKMVEKLTNAPLLYPYLCTELFDGVTTTGAVSWGLSSTLPHPPSKVFTTKDYEDIEMVDPPPQMDIPASALTLHPQQVPQQYPHL